MKEKFYPFRASEDYLNFYFESCSSGCTIRKMVEYEEIGVELYNLAFGDVDENGQLNDSIISNNGDMQKVLATVVQTVLAFLEIYPDRQVYFSGSSDSRNRLYRAIIGRDFENWSDSFEVAGMSENGPVEFSPEVDFKGFIVKRKRHCR